MSGPRRVKGGTRRVQRRQVVRQRRTGPAKPELQAPQLDRAPLDFSRATYLSVAEAIEYLRVATAAQIADPRQWRLARKRFDMWALRKRVIPCRLGDRKRLFLRRDLDEAVQREKELRQSA